eukprot:CAMPEP_0202079890 /NCGR_PEP_ID=MMETSP0964-20121228/6744_1 /ASSEMBLY_ACC=CAM_ASM_000500 /TAXON_ID=4773 /ORGANISM="Schizochytrium aggregatum, Strain ATCC28209" /LENGTH=80 /DNA_ID=CAMNT_0048647247 /DNA_START=132 /DNA_END=374 /DNA_ORIENTATION=+
MDKRLDGTTHGDRTAREHGPWPWPMVVAHGPLARPMAMCHGSLTRPTKFTRCALALALSNSHGKRVRQAAVLFEEKPAIN